MREPREMGRSRVGRREREARKRHRRAWVRGHMHANFRLFLAYPHLGAESPTLKLGKKHYSRHWLKRLAMLTEPVADSRKQEGK